MDAYDCKGQAHKSKGKQLKDAHRETPANTAGNGGRYTSQPNVKHGERRARNARCGKKTTTLTNPSVGHPQVQRRNSKAKATRLNGGHVQYVPCKRPLPTTNSKATARRPSRDVREMRDAERKLPRSQTRAWGTPKFRGEIQKKKLPALGSRHVHCVQCKRPLQPNCAGGNSANEGRPGSKAQDE